MKLKLTRKEIISHIKQLENELRYCLIVMETNLDMSNDLHVPYIKQLLAVRVRQLWRR